MDWRFPSTLHSLQGCAFSYPTLLWKGVTMDLRLNNSVKRVITISHDSSGKRTATTLHQKKRKKKKKGTRGLNTVDKLALAINKANQSFTDSYRSYHNKSNRNQKDGWLIDLPSNLYKASSKEWKKFRKTAPKRLT